MSFPQNPTIQQLEEADRLAHGGLDVQAFDVLPVLLEERDKEVDGFKKTFEHVNKHRGMGFTKHDIGKNGVLSHLNVSNGHTKAQDLVSSVIRERKV